MLPEVIAATPKAPVDVRPAATAATAAIPITARKQAAEASADRDAARAFVAKHLEEFGVLGRNNAVKERRPVVALPALTSEQTRDNHFRFGFDAGIANRRPTRSSSYWTETGACTRPARMFQLELRQALTEMADRFGRISISNSGNALSGSVIWEAKRLGIPFEIVTVAVEGHGVPAHDPELTHRVHTLSWDAFVDFAKEFAADAGAPDAWQALEALHGEAVDTAHVYTNHRLSIFHANFDYAREEVVGPPLWCVSDHEQSTAINRRLLARGKRGVPQILYWSPELIVSQLTSPFLRSRLRRSSAARPTLPPSEHRWNTFMLLRETYPKLPLEPSMERARDPSFVQKMGMLQRTLRRLNPGHNALHSTPLHLYLRRLGVDEDVHGLSVTSEDFYGSSHA
jgi:hypothetical protein